MRQPPADPGGRGQLPQIHRDGWPTETSALVRRSIGRAIEDDLAGVRGQAPGVDGGQYLLIQDRIFSSKMSTSPRAGGESARAACVRVACVPESTAMPLRVKSRLRASLRGRVLKLYFNNHLEERTNHST